MTASGRSSGIEEKTVLSPGTVLRERYVIDSVAGAGGFAVTYKAWDPLLDCFVAVKEYRKGMERFLEEARVMARFRSERNLVNVYDFFREENAAYIVMEFLTGETLKQRLLRDKKLETQEALTVIKSVLGGLSEIHAKGLIHRDIAPDNIFLCENGTVKLFDFGCARSIGSKSSLVEIKQGYSPPEQYDPECRAEKSSDVYSAAAVFYRMLTGKAPPAAMERLREDRMDTFIKARDIPSCLRKVLLKGLALRPEHRFATADEFLKEINTGCGMFAGRKRTVPVRRYATVIWIVLILGFVWFKGAGREDQTERKEESGETAAKAVSGQHIYFEGTETAAAKETAAVPETAGKETDIAETAIAETAIKETAIKETDLEETAIEETAAVETADKEKTADTAAETAAERAAEEASKEAAAGDETAGTDESKAIPETEIILTGTHGTADHPKVKPPEEPTEGNREMPEPTVPELTGW